MESSQIRFQGGLGLVAVAAGLLLFTAAPITVPITLLIVGIVLIATSRRDRDAA